MIVTIHQPEHLPWLGFFDKISQCDLYVMLDHVSYRKNYFQNRNRIRTVDGTALMTVPVLQKGHSHQAISEVLINNEGSPRWREKCWRTLLQHYKNSQYWNQYSNFFEELYSAEWNRLVELNEAIIRYLLRALSLTPHLVKSSNLIVKGDKSSSLLRICENVGATVYVSGVSGKTYLDLVSFEEAGIEVRFQEFHHPIYRQLHEPFVPCTSIIDLLFNCGPKSSDILRGVGVERMDEVFE